MTSVFAFEMQSLLDDMKRKERIVELVQKFVDTGGKHRLSISVDHPDPEVKAAMEDIAARNIPADLLIKGFTRFAYDEAAIARASLVNSAIVFAPAAASPEVAP